MNEKRIEIRLDAVFLLFYFLFVYLYLSIVFIIYHKQINKINK